MSDDFAPFSSFIRGRPSREQAEARHTLLLERLPVALEEFRSYVAQRGGPSLEELDGSRSGFIALQTWLEEESASHGLESLALGLAAYVAHAFFVWHPSARWGLKDAPGAAGDMGSVVRVGQGHPMSPEGFADLVITRVRATPGLLELLYDELIVQPDHEVASLEWPTWGGPWVWVETHGHEDEEEAAAELSSENLAPSPTNMTIVVTEELARHEEFGRRVLPELVAALKNLDGIGTVLWRDRGAIDVDSTITPPDLGEWVTGWVQPFLPPGFPADG